MSVFKQLRPFVFVCQLSGFSPFYMESKKSTNQFIKFSFSWKKPVTWWFTFIFVAQFVFAYFDTSILWDFFYEEGVDKGNIPSVIVLFNLLELVSFFVLIGVARYVIYRISHVKRAIKLIQKVDHILNSPDFPGTNILSIKRPVVAGIFLTFLCVSCVLLRPTDIDKILKERNYYCILKAFSLVASTYPLTSIIPDSGRNITASVMSVIWFILILMVMCSFTLTNLSYSIVASYIKLVAYDLKCFSRSEFPTNTKEIYR